jgi:hypothetical protein
VKLVLDDETRRAVEARIRAEGWRWASPRDEVVWGNRLVHRISQALEADEDPEGHARLAFSECLGDAALAGAVVPATPCARAALKRIARHVERQRARGMIVP